MDLSIRQANWLDVSTYYDRWNSFKNIPPPQSIRIGKTIYEMPNTVTFEFTCAAYLENRIVGMCTLFDKNFEHIRIGGIGRMAVDPYFRGNGVAKEILMFMKNIMERIGFDISVLWASDLKVYPSKK